jgi:hypothetical protein
MAVANKKSAVASKTKRNLLPAGSAGGDPRITITPTPEPVVITNLEPETQAPKQIVIDPNKRLASDTVDDLYALKLVAAILAPSSDSLKAELQQHGAKYADGTYATATLNAGGVPKTVDPAKFLEYCRQAQLNDEKIASMISISQDAMSQHFTKTEVDACLLLGKPKSPSMVVDVTK